MQRKFRSGPLFVSMVVLLSATACDDGLTGPGADGGDPAPSVVTVSSPPPPAGLVSVGFSGRTLQLWPYTGEDLAGTMADPINIIFTGQVDIVSLRAALMALNGDRTAFGFPNVFPFNCTWTDASGGMQTSWSDGDGWVGNPVQLECGSYELLRFHIRLFPAGEWVVAGAHLDLLIPNTPQHQVISWELAQQFIVVDFLRSGLLDPAAPLTQVAINASPSFRAIPGVIWDGIPASLKALLGGPPSSGGAPVPIPSDGRATILNVGTRATVIASLTESDFTLPFNQIIPRPFCALGPADVVLVQGPVRITTRTMVNDQGELRTQNTVRAEVDVTPIDPSTGQPLGQTFRGLIENLDESGSGPWGSSVNALLRRLALPPSEDGHNSFMTHLVTSPNGGAQYTLREQC